MRTSPCWIGSRKARAANRAHIGVARRTRAKSRIARAADIDVAPGNDKPGTKPGLLGAHRKKRRVRESRGDQAADRQAFCADL
jgi:hypothetical protein